MPSSHARSTVASACSRGSAWGQPPSGAVPRPSRVTSTSVRPIRARSSACVVIRRAYALGIVTVGLRGERGGAAGAVVERPARAVPRRGRHLATGRLDLRERLAAGRAALAESADPAEAAAADEDVAGAPAGDEACEPLRRQEDAAREAAHRRHVLAGDDRRRRLLDALDEKRHRARAAVCLRVGERRPDVASAPWPGAAEGEAAAALWAPEAR